MTWAGDVSVATNLRGPFGILPVVLFPRSPWRAKEFLCPWCSALLISPASCQTPFCSLPESTMRGCLPAIVSPPACSSQSFESQPYEKRSRTSCAEMGLKGSCLTVVSGLDRCAAWLCSSGSLRAYCVKRVSTDDD